MGFLITDPGEENETHPQLKYIGLILAYYGCKFEYSFSCNRIQKCSGTSQIASLGNASIFQGSYPPTIVLEQNHPFGFKLFVHLLVPKLMV